MYKVGLIINPIAGIGGRAGLKGSDSPEIQQKALSEGFRSLAPERVAAALTRLAGMKEQIEILTYSQEMGENVAKSVGFPTTVLSHIESGQTTAADTVAAAQAMKQAKVDLILFAGGDGTARNICTAVERGIAVLGIPCGVKMHSACYAINPRRAGDIVKSYLENPSRRTTDGEVMDIDEEAFRQGNVCACLYGYLKVPEAGILMQKMKSGSGYSQSSQLLFLGALFADRMEEDVLYIIGPGSTTAYVMKELQLSYTLLGVDLVADKQLLASDVNEAQIWQAMQHYAKTVIIITVIGGQGHLFGRGNQQLSPRIIRRTGRENIWIMVSKQKLAELTPAPFLVDTGDPELDQSLCGYIRIAQSGTQDIPYRIEM